MLARLAGHAAPPGGLVPRHLTPGVQRLADRLADVPLATPSTPDADKLAVLNVVGLQNMTTEV